MSNDKPETEFAHPEWLGMLTICAARWHVERILKGQHSRGAFAKVKPLLPYCIDVDGEHPRVRNRYYRPKDEPPEEAPMYIPAAACRFDTKTPRTFFLFTDGCAPWYDRASAERYLAKLDELFDFRVDAVIARSEFREVQS